MGGEHCATLPTVVIIPGYGYLALRRRLDFHVACHLTKIVAKMWQIVALSSRDLIIAAPRPQFLANRNVSRCYVGR